MSKPQKEYCSIFLLVSHKLGFISINREQEAMIISTLIYVLCEMKHHAKLLGFVSEGLEHADTMTYLIRRNIFNKKDLCVKNCN